MEERFEDRKFTSTGAGVITVMVSAALEERVGVEKWKTKNECEVLNEECLLPHYVNGHFWNFPPLTSSQGALSPDQKPPHASVLGLLDSSAHFQPPPFQKYIYLHLKLLI